MCCDLGLSGGDVERSEAEALDGGENVVGGFYPAKGLRVGVDGVDGEADGGFRFFSGAADAAADVPFGDLGEEAFRQVDPGTRGRREMDMPSRAPATSGSRASCGWRSCP